MLTYIYRLLTSDKMSLESPLMSDVVNAEMNGNGEIDRKQ